MEETWNKYFLQKVDQPQFICCHDSIIYWDSNLFLFPKNSAADYFRVFFPDVDCAQLYDL